MGKARIALGVMSFALLGAALGYVLASAFLTFRWFGVGAEIDFLMLARSIGLMRRGKMARRPVIGAARAALRLPKGCRKRRFRRVIRAWRRPRRATRVFG